MGSREGGRGLPPSTTSGTKKLEIIFSFYGWAYIRPTMVTGSRNGTLIAPLDD